MNAELIFPELLWLIPALIILSSACYIWKKNSYFSLLLRSISIILFVLALAEPVQKNTKTSNKAVALFDISKSIPKAARQAMAEKAIEYAKSNQSEIESYLFGEELEESSLTINAKTSVNQLVNFLNSKQSDQSNIEKSLQLLAEKTAAASILLFSDGNETNKSEPIKKRFKIYPIMIEDSLFIKRNLSITDIDAPTIIKSGDRANINISIRNNSDRTINETLEILIDGEKLKTKAVSVPANSQKLVAVESEEIKGGKHKVIARLKDDELQTWITAHEKSKTLLLSGKLEDEKVIASLLRLKGYKLEQVVAGEKSFPEELSSYSTIIFNNLAKEQIPPGFLAKLKSYTSEGGGLLLLGGNRSFGLGGYIGSELEEISPLKFTPPQAEKRRLTNAIALVMDKSGSMAEQDKITSAKKAALSSIESLKDEDYISVIGFDFAPFVIIDLQKVAIVKQTAEARLRNLTAVGKTNLLPALAAARQKLNNCPASRKHIIVLSDGKFPLESDQYVDEINKLREGGITVSAVALGIEADVPFMKILARYGKGAFYQTIDATSLPEIFVEDIKVSTQENSLNEQSNFPVAVGPAGVHSTTIEKYRPLRGFVETLPKNGSTLELITKSKNQAFPILASWKYNKGKVIAFTSDTNGRWSSPWLSWDKFSIFWGELMQNLQPQDNQNRDVEFDLRYKIEGQKLKLNLAIYGKDQAISAILNNTKEKINFESIAKGRYLAELEIKKADDYFFDIKVGETKLPEIGINVKEIGEQSVSGINKEYLLSLAKDSKGELNPEKLQLRQEINNETKPLYLPLIVLGFFIVLLEAFVRESRIR